MARRWDSSAAGHLDAGESYDACVIRELEEEAGQKGDGLELLAKLPASEATGWEFVHLYRAVQDGPIRFPCAEVEAGLWLTPEAVDAWIARRSGDFASGFLECWKAWKKSWPATGGGPGSYSCTTNLFRCAVAGSIAIHWSSLSACGAC